MNRVNDILKQFNFSDEEIDIYIAVLSLGKANVSQIARKIGKNRTTIYFHVDKLIQKGVLSETRKGKKLGLVAIEPFDLAATLDRSLVEFKSLVPQLEALKKATDESPVIEITESKAGYYKVLDEISNLPEGATFRVIEGQDGVLDELSLISDEKLKTFFKKLIERKITARGIFTEEALQIARRDMGKDSFELLSKRLQETKTLPQNILSIKNLAMAYNDKVSFLFPDTALVLTIKNKKLNEFFTAMFDGLFYIANPVERY